MATQQHIAPENNSYEAFRPAPTSDSLLINRVPVSASPLTPPASKDHRRCSAPSHWHRHRQRPHPPSLGPHHQAHHLPGYPGPPNRCPLFRQKRHPTLQPHPPGQGDVVGHPRYSMHPLLAIWPPSCWLPERPLQRPVLSQPWRHSTHSQSSPLPSMPRRTSYAKDDR